MKFFSHTDVHSRSKRPQDSFLHRILNDPYLDWFYLIIIAAIMVGVVAGVGFVVYFNVQDRLSESTTVIVPKSSSLFDSAAMTRTLKDFENRAAERTKVLNGHGTIVDPSL